jgi:hypothetical protein
VVSGALVYNKRVASLFLFVFVCLFVFIFDHVVLLRLLNSCLKYGFSFVQQQWVLSLLYPSVGRMYVFFPVVPPLVSFGFCST